MPCQYEAWRARHGRAPWQQFPLGGTWQFDNGRFMPLPRTRGVVVRVPTAAGVTAKQLAVYALTPDSGLAGFPWGLYYGEPPKPLTDLRNFFQRKPGIDAVHVVAFPVRK